MTTAKNQCAGCQAGWPVEWLKGRATHVTSYPRGGRELMSCTAHLYGVTIECPVDQWRPIPLMPCDTCSSPATWQHPDGGFRCDQCPRPLR